MSKMQLPGSASEVSGHAAASCKTLELISVIDESITAGMILRRRELLGELTEINVSRSLSVVPIQGNFLLKSLFTSALEDVMTQLWILGYKLWGAVPEDLSVVHPGYRPTACLFVELICNKLLDGGGNKLVPKPQRCNNGLALIKTMSDIDYLKALKYGVYDANLVKDELDGIDVNNLNCTIYKIKKLEADRKYVDTVMVETYVALAQYFTFDPLVSYIKSIEELDLYRTNLAEEENKNRMLRRELSRQVRQQRNHMKTVLYDTEAIIDKLRTQVEDSVLYAEVSSRYIDNWQEARTEQHTQTIFNIENKPSTKIEYYKQRIDHELRVHTEVETLVTISITETLAKIEEWMAKFDKDMEQIDLKIQVKKNYYQDKRDTNRQYEETLAIHDEKMKNWIKFKKEREIARFYHEKMLNSAIIVQAWWRGLLVRLCLGPYKVKKHRKEKKKPG